MAENGKFSGREVVIVEAARLPVGRGHEEKGYYKDVHASSLLAKTYDEVIKRAGIDASEVEDVVSGCVQQFGEQGINIARNAWLEAGLPIETPATTVDRQCGSSQQATNLAASMVRAGVVDAGGFGLQVILEGMLKTVEELAEEYDSTPEAVRRLAEDRDIRARIRGHETRRRREERRALLPEGQRAVGEVELHAAVRPVREQLRA